MSHIDKQEGLLSLTCNCHCNEFNLLEESQSPRVPGSRVWRSFSDCSKVAWSR